MLLNVASGNGKDPHTFLYFSKSTYFTFWFGLINQDDTIVTRDFFEESVEFLDTW